MAPGHRAPGTTATKAYKGMRERSSGARLVHGPDSATLTVFIDLITKEIVDVLNSMQFW